MANTGYHPDNLIFEGTLNCEDTERNEIVHYISFLKEHITKFKKTISNIQAENEIYNNESKYLNNIMMVIKKYDIPNMTQKKELLDLEAKIEKYEYDTNLELQNMMNFVDVYNNIT